MLASSSRSTVLRSIQRLAVKSERMILPSRMQAALVPRFMSAPATAAYDQTVNTFPSIVIGPNRSIVPMGTFAEAQAEVRYGTESNACKTSSRDDN